MIEVANTLLPIGKNRILDSAYAYGEVEKVNHGISLLLRVIFDFPESEAAFPVPSFGALSPSAPIDRAMAPRFPMALVDGVPFLMISSYWLFGQPASPLNDVRWFREHAELRAAPLRPPDAPLTLLSRLEAAPDWMFGKNAILREPSWMAPDRMIYTDERGYELVKPQILQLMSTLPDMSFLNDTSISLEERWAAAISNIEGRATRWNADQMKYEFAE